MKKLKLRIDELFVESFVADAPVSRTGTVEGQDFTLQCAGTDLCTASCYGTCAGAPGGYTCGGPWCGGTRDIQCTETGNTTGNEPCLPTCDNDYSCNVMLTCVETCMGYPTGGCG